MYKLSPSDFAYLYEECKLCYWLKVKKGIYQPSMPMPGVFSAINTRIQGTLIGKNLQSLSADLPQAVVKTQEGWVESKLVPETGVYIKGKYDLLAQAADGGNFLVDLKISQPHEDKIDKYKTQLSAYKFALENPKSGVGVKIARMGLLIFYPDAVAFENGAARVNFPPSWLEIPLDEAGFLAFAREVNALLDGPAPEEGTGCKWCQYRHKGEEETHEEAEVKQQDIPF